MSLNRIDGDAYSPVRVGSAVNGVAAHVLDPGNDFYAVSALGGQPETLTTPPTFASRVKGNFCSPGDRWLVYDLGQNAGSQPIAIAAGAGMAFAGGATSVTIAANGGALQLTVLDDGVTIQASFLPSGPATGGNSQTQATWWVDPVNGKPTNTGLTQAAAVDSFATIAARTLGQNAVPVFNPTGGTVTIHVVSTTPQTDPLSVLLNCQLVNGATMIVEGVAQAPTHSGTIATASAFARTNAGGRIGITDGTVANFQPLVGALFVDATAGSVGFLAAPRTGSSATGTVSVPYSAQTPGVFPSPTIGTPTAGDSYQLLPLVGVYMGTELKPQSFPTAIANASTVYLYRISPYGAFAGDVFQVLADDFVSVAFQECLFANVSPQVTGQGFALFINCGLAQTTGNSLTVAAGGSCEVFGGGYCYNGYLCAIAANVTVDQDFAHYGDQGTGNRPTTSFGNLTVGDASAWMTSGPGEVLAIEGGAAVFTRIFRAGNVFYGNSTGNFIIQTFNEGSPILPSTIRIDNRQSATNTFAFNGTPTFGMLSTPFTVNLATGAFIGPTTPTVTTLDAVAGAGTGLAGLAWDLKTGCRINIA